MILQLTVMDVSARRAWSSPPRRDELIDREIAFTCNALDSVALVCCLNGGEPYGFANSPEYVE